MSETVPSFYGTYVPGQDDGAPSPYNNLMLRYGEVQKIIYPKNKLSRSKRVREYDVLVTHYENNTFNSIIYHNCVLGNPIGGVGDKCSYTLRADPTAIKAVKARSGGIKPGKGSKVLLLCLNGSRDNAIIISGLRDQKDSSQHEDEADGENFYFEYNGVEMYINKNGDLSVAVRGKTDANGDGKKNTYPQITVKSNGDIELNSTGTMIIRDEKDTKILGHGLKVGSASDWMMMGSTYRAAQSALHISLSTALAAATTATILKSWDALGIALGAMASAITSFEANSNGYLSVRNKLD